MQSKGLSRVLSNTTVQKQKLRSHKSYSKPLPPKKSKITDEEKSLKEKRKKRIGTAPVRKYIGAINLFQFPL